MNESELLGPCAYGKPCGQAVLKASAEDFQVDERLDFELTGQGEHLWLWVEKRGLNTEEAARKLARAAGLPIRAVSYAGLKDRQALTRQWFSLHLPGKSDPDLSAAESDQLHILRLQRHGRKLQRGAHSRNGFTLRLTALQADREALDKRLQQLAAGGVPNYFGLQRFGFDGGNVVDARSFAERNELPMQRNVRSRLLSSARSYLFNRMLAERVKAGTWNKALIGDLLAFTDSRSFFPATDETINDHRLGELDVHPTGPLFGAEASPASADVARAENALAGQESSLVNWLSRAGMKQERRILRLPIAELTWHYPAPDILQLEFVLPAGCFATVVVRELLELVSAKPTDIPCEF